MNLQTIEAEPLPSDSMTLDDLAMLQLVDTYNPNRRVEIETCGIKPERLALYNIGAAALTGTESTLLNQALYS